MTDTSRIIAYGKNRKQSDFKGQKYDVLILETVPKGQTAQPELSDTIHDYLYHGHGDVMLILEPKDIPVKGPYREAIEAKGATIQVVSTEPVRPGPKSKLDGVSQAMYDEIREVWDKPYIETWAAKEISGKLGSKVDRYWCRRNLGKRAFKLGK